MVKHSALAALAAHLIGLAAAGTTVWDGSFNDLTVASLDDWSWSNQVGPYQWYIHGSGETSEYVAIDAANANPGDGASTQGAKLTLTSTAFWNGQTMRRTELIPQAADVSALTSGTVYYHFSMKREDVNAPSVAREHQIAFFESHFTELKYGLDAGAAGTGDTTLRWMANSEVQWNATLDAGVWHNFVYEIDFAASTVGFWHSTGGDELTQVVAPVAATVSSNGADWHVGVLELPVTGVADTDEDLFFSGVYIETGDLTTAFTGGSGAGTVADVPAPTVAPTSAAPAKATVAPLAAAATPSAAPASKAPATTTDVPDSSTACKRRRRRVAV